MPAPGLGLLGEDNPGEDNPSEDNLGEDNSVAAAQCHPCHGEQQERAQHKGGSILGFLARCFLAAPAALAWMSGHRGAP